MFDYKIVKDIAVIERSKGFALKLNLISYNNKKPKYDLRRWDERGEGAVMGKGITMNHDELISLRDTLNSMEL